MTRAAWLLVGFILAAFLITPARAVAYPVETQDFASLPAPKVHTSPLAHPAQPGPDLLRADPPPAVMRPAESPETAVGRLGLAAGVSCWNCAPFNVVIRLSHYDPMAGPINCWDYGEAEKYCFSPMFPGVHWKGFWGLAAACPPEWPLGSWVVVPDAGAFICMDRGGSITCDENTGICNVDILGPSVPGDGSVMPVTIWVPLDPAREG